MALDGDHVRLVAESVGLSATSAAELYDMAEANHLCHADLCAPLLSRFDAGATEALTRLVGHPLRPRPTPDIREAGRQLMHQVRPTMRRLDPRVIIWIAEECPKQQGSKSAERWALYRVGMTVTDYVRAGGKPSDVRWDLDHGHIRVSA